MIAGAGIRVDPEALGLYTLALRERPPPERTYTALTIELALAFRTIELFPWRRTGALREDGMSWPPVAAE